MFRNPSGYSNGNTFDFEGRQLSCEHGNRRVARYEYNGTVTVIADKFGGKRLNSPNDIVVHPDGGIWFTDPTYGIQGSYEGFQATPEIKQAVYRVDPKTMQIEKVTDELDQPNGICFSPDYKKVYIADTGSGRETKVFDLDGNKLKNGKRFVQFANGAADGMRCDVDGNLVGGSASGSSDRRAQRRTDRDDPVARELRECGVSAAPNATGCSWREPVAVHGLRRHHWRAHHLRANCGLECLALRYRCTRPEPPSFKSAFTSATFTRLKSPGIECFRQLAATANSSVS